MNYTNAQHVNHQMQFEVNYVKQQGRVMSKTMFLLVPILK